MLHARTLASVAALALASAIGLFAWSTLSGDEPAPVAALAPALEEPTPEGSRAATPLDGREHLAATAPPSVPAPTVEPRASEVAPDPPGNDPRPAGSEREAVATAFVLSGRVTDEETGAPVPGTRLHVVAADSVLAAADVDPRGRYRLELKDESATHVMVRPPDGWNVREPRASLPPIVRGARAEVDFALLRWPPPVAGDIRGLLQSEGGSWSLQDLPSTDAVVLDLVSTTAPRIQLRGRVEAREDGDGGHWLGFVFEDVPRGEYELTLSSLDNYRWHPTSVFVSPPAENLVFLRYDLDATLPLTFRVYELTTGEPVENYTVRHIKLTLSDDNGVLLHTGPLDPDAFPIDARFEWSLWADGCAPVFGDERSFTIAEGERVAEVRLPQGWGARFLVLGGQGTKYPLAGATILLDGESAGTTRDDGTLDVYRKETPGAIDVRYLDWKLKHDPREPLNGRTPERRGMVVPVLLEPPG